MGTPLWSMQLTLSPWAAVDGSPQDGPLRIAGLVSDEELRSLQARCPEGAVVVADVVLQESSPLRAHLLALVEPP